MARQIYKNLLKLSGVFLVFLLAANANATPITTSAEVVGNITVTEQTPLNFGQFTVGTGGGLITFNAGGAISAGGDVVLIGGEVGGVARLDTTGSVVGNTVTVNVTGGNLVSGINTMAVVANCMGPGGVLGVNDGPCTFLSNSTTTDDVQIGGQLTVSGNQATGIYTGTIEVTAGF